MQIPFVDQSLTPAGDIVRRYLDFNGEAGVAAAANLKDILIDAGWTEDNSNHYEPTLQSVECTFSGIPANDNTITIGANVYRWKTTLSEAVNVLNATNANPIEIETATAHGLTNGWTVDISGVTGNTAANGTWVITYVSTTKFTIDTAGNGGYIAGGTVIRDGADLEIKIGGSTGTCIDNFIKAINADGVEGSNYGYGLVAHPNVTAALKAGSTTVVVVTAKSLDDGNIAVSESCTNFVWAALELSGASWRLLSAKTDQGFQIAVIVYDVSSTQVGVKLQNFDASIASFKWGLKLGFDGEIVAHKYGFLSFYPGDTVLYGNGILSMLQVPAWAQPSAITNATADTPTDITAATNATPIQITVEDAQSWQTDEYVVVSGVEGNTAANGTHRVTRLTDTTYELQGTTGNGEYTTGGSAVRRDRVLIACTQTFVDGDAITLDQSDYGPEPDSDPPADWMNVNGDWLVINRASNSFRLQNSSALTGNWNSEQTTYLAGPGQCLLAAFLSCDYFNQNAGTAWPGVWRNGAQWPKAVYSTLANEHWEIFNRTVDDGGIAGKGDLQLFGVPASSSFIYYNLAYDLRPAIAGWSPIGATVSSVGAIFNCAVPMCSLPLDTEFPDADGNLWHNWSADLGSKNAAFLFRIPEGRN